MPARPEEGPIGVLGGTFDPVHLGHLRLAEEARELLGLTRVLFVPAGTPPHRSPPQTDKRHRLAMVRRAIEGNNAFVLDDGEVAAEAPSYTVVTLERLRAAHGDARPLVLLLGADAFLGLAGWHRWRNLFDLAHLAVAGRPGVDLPAAGMDAALADEYRRRRPTPPASITNASSGAVIDLAITPLAISASRIRADLAGSRSVRYLVPDAVLDYIRRHQLYRSS